MVYDKNKFKSVSPIVATYSFQEVQSGTGFVNYFAFAGATNTNDVFEYHLTTQLPRSDEIEVQISTVAPGFKNFDLTPFKIATTAGGQATVTLSFSYTETVGGQVAHLEIDIIHYDGSNETVIGTDRVPNATSTQEQNKTLVIDVTDTVFNIGDILRLKVKAIKTQGSGNPNYEVGIDPQNRDGTNLTPSTEDRTTQLKLVMPFRIFA